MDHHEAAAADVAGARIGHGQRKAGGDRGVDRIAALPQDVGADLRGEFFLRHHHAVFGRNGANRGELRRRIESGVPAQRPAVPKANTSATAVIALRHWIENTAIENPPQLEPV